MRKHNRLALFLALGLALLTALPASAASAIGFVQEGRYSDGDPAFLIDTENAVFSYNGEFFWDSNLDYGELYTQGSLYIPILCTDDTEDQSFDDICDMGRISTYKVKVVSKADPDQFVDSVSIVDGSAAQSDLVEPGAHIRVDFSDAPTAPEGDPITLQLVLSVNRLTQQDAGVWMRARVRNRTEEIKKRSVYSAELPTAFRTKTYSGSATIDFGDGVSFTGPVAKNGYYYMSLNRDPVKAVTDSAEKKTHLEFYTFEGDHKTFAGAGELEIPVSVDDFKPKAKEDPKIYAYERNGTKLRALESSEVSFRNRDSTMVFYTKTLGSYVLSSKPLLRAVEDKEGNILQTGYAADGNDEPNGSSSSQPLPPLESESGTMPSQPPTEGTGNPPSGGDAVYAANPSTHNPSTADPSALPLPLLLAGSALCAVLLPSLYRRAFRSQLPRF